MKDKRIEWIDVAKAIGIIIVLAYHACPDGYFKNMMWQIHMPQIAFLSGKEYKEENSLNLSRISSKMGVLSEKQVIHNAKSVRQGIL